MRLVEDENEEKSFDGKVGQEMRFLEEGLHCEEFLLLTVSCSVLLVHHHLVLL